jgi:hypothetical protein
LNNVKPSTSKNGIPGAGDRYFASSFRALSWDWDAILASLNYVEGGVGDRILQRTHYALTALNPAENPYLQWMIALILGLLVMLIEAIAWQGLDNLFIPLGGFILLRLYLALDALTLLVRLIVTIVLVTFVLCWRQRTTLNDSALLGTAFIG